MPSLLNIIARFLTTLVFGVIKYLYAVSNRSMFAILTGTFPLTTLSKHSQISVMISRFEVFQLIFLAGQVSVVPYAAK